MNIHVIPTTQARKHLSALIDRVRFSHESVAIGRRDKAEALLIKFPGLMNTQVDEWTNINQQGGGFDFLQKEPDIYSLDDVKKSYV